ncbi:MAG: hypothetical protein BRC24_01800, partial [Parcubacteria group bacterium SW_4_46_8]
MTAAVTNTIKMTLPAAIAFFVGIGVTPVVTHYLYKYKAWKKESGNKEGLGDDNGTPIFNELHAEAEVNTPRMGGVVVIVGVFATTALFWGISYAITGGPSGKINFLS